MATQKTTRKPATRKSTTTTRKARSIPLKVVDEPLNSQELTPQQQAEIQLRQLEEQLNAANAAQGNTPVKAFINLLATAGVKLSYDTLLNLDNKNVEVALVFQANGKDFRIGAALLAEVAQQINMTAAVAANICSECEEQLSQPEPAMDALHHARMTSLGIHSVRLIKAQVSEVAVADKDNG